MILNVSGRTDIVAFYTKWFMNRYKEGYVDVRNPFSPKLVSRINFNDVDLIMFCTKNPIPIVKFLKDIDNCNNPVSEGVEPARGLYRHCGSSCNDQVTLWSIGRR